MKIIINQYFGIGDIIFCMTIARRWIKEGHEIYWPVLPHFVEGLQRAYLDVNFVNWKDWKIDYERRNEHDVLIDGKEYRVIPLRWNVEIMNVPYSRCMETKYGMFGWDYKEWKEDAMFTRSEQRENELAAYLGIDFTTSYTLTNKYFGSNSQFHLDIPVKGVEIRTIKGFSLFDYSKLLENAEHIHVANSSILYLLELLDLKAKSVHLYARKPQEQDFRNTQYIHSKKYVLHT